MKTIHGKALLIAILFLFSAISTSTALAQDSLYAGGGIGISKSSKICSDLGGTGGSGGTCDKKDIGYKMVAGYKFTRYLGAEVGYVTLGEFKATGTVDSKAKTKGFQVMGTGMFEIDKDFWVLGKLGIFRWDITTHGPFGSLTASGSKTGTGMILGIGVQYDFSNQFSVRGEWERFFDIGKDIGKIDVDLISVNGIWRFW